MTRDSDLRNTDLQRTDRQIFVSRQTGKRLEEASKAELAERNKGTIFACAAGGIAGDIASDVGWKHGWGYPLVIRALGGFTPTTPCSLVRCTKCSLWRRRWLGNSRQESWVEKLREVWS